MQASHNFTAFTVTLFVLWTSVVIKHFAIEVLKMGMVGEATHGFRTALQKTFG